MQRMAQNLRISSVLMSQIFSGSRRPQPEHAFKMASFIGLNSAETDYFLSLVQLEEAGAEEYKKFLQRRIEFQRSQSTEIKNRVARDIRLPEEVKARFYSHWHYSALRLLTDIPGLQTVGDLAKALSLESAYVAEILEFLVAHKLCSYENGKYRMAVQSTHLEFQSPWIFSRQQHWRQKAIQKMEHPNLRELFYTGPMVLSEGDQKKIREKLVQVIREVTEKARTSNSEKLVCLNIDWFEIWKGFDEDTEISHS